MNRDTQTQSDTAKGFETFASRCARLREDVEALEVRVANLQTEVTTSIQRIEEMIAVLKGLTQ